MFFGQLTAEPHLGKNVQSVFLPKSLYVPLPSRVAALWTLCPNLKKFVSFASTEWSEMAHDCHVEALVQTCKQLEHISILPAVDLTDKGVMAIAAHCPQLLSLNISSAGRITDVSVKKLVDSCPMLQEFVLMCTHVTAEGAGYLIRNGKNLTFLNVSDCLIDSDEAEMLHTLAPERLEFVADNTETSDEDE